MQAFSLSQEFPLSMSGHLELLRSVQTGIQIHLKKLRKDKAMYLATLTLTGCQVKYIMVIIIMYALPDFEA